MPAVYNKLPISRFMHQSYKCIPRYFSNHQKETADQAVLRAQRETAAMSEGNDRFTPIQKLALTARILANEGHGKTLSDRLHYVI